jgi:hypothetical protein
MGQKMRTVVPWPVSMMPLIMILGNKLFIELVDHFIPPLGNLAPPWPASPKS